MESGNKLEASQAPQQRNLPTRRPQKRAASDRFFVVMLRCGGGGGFCRESLFLRREPDPLELCEVTAGVPLGMEPFVTAVIVSKY